MKKGLEVEGAAGDDVFLQYFYFTSLFQNCYFLKIFPLEIPHLPNHSSWQNSSKPAFILDFPCLFLILSASFNIFLFSLSRNPNVSFLCSQFVHFPSLGHSQSLFHSMYFTFLFSPVSYTCFSVVVCDEFCPHPTPPHLTFLKTQKFSLLTAFSFLHKLFYYLQFITWKLLHCLSHASFKQFFFRPIISTLSFSLFILFSCSIFRRGRWNFLDFW